MPNSNHTLTKNTLYSRFTNEPVNLELLWQFMLDRCITNNECLIWTGPTSSQSRYSAVRFCGLAEYGHRISYVLFHGDIPPEYVIDHLCKQTLCINPDHLALVTPQENVHRSSVYHKSSCNYGHILSPENLYTNNGRRECLQCRNDRNVYWNPIRNRQRTRQPRRGK